jgi:hypothetical protein
MALRCKTICNKILTLPLFAVAAGAVRLDVKSPENSARLPRLRAIENRRKTISRKRQMPEICSR